MSPRAAWRLEQLGFTSVYDYTAGKVDWLAAGEPTEGDKPPMPRVASGADPRVPVCQLGDQAGSAVAAAQEMGWPICVVLNEAGVVAGRLRVDRLERDDRRRADEAMESGPATIRAHDDLVPTLARMADRHVEILLVTTPEGRLIGALRSQR
jgi:CBS domain-containing protein